MQLKIDALWPTTYDPKRVFESATYTDECKKLIGSDYLKFEFKGEQTLISEEELAQLVLNLTRMILFNGESDSFFSSLAALQLRAPDGFSLERGAEAFKQHLKPLIKSDKASAF